MDKPKIWCTLELNVLMLFATQNMKKHHQTEELALFFHFVTKLLAVKHFKYTINHRLMNIKPWEQWTEKN